MTEGDVVAPSSCSVKKSVRVIYIKTVYAVKDVSTLFNKVEGWQLQCVSCLEQVSKSEE